MNVLNTLMSYKHVIVSLSKCRFLIYVYIYIACLTSCPAGSMNAIPLRYYKKKYT